MFSDRMTNNNFEKVEATGERGKITKVYMPNSCVEIRSVCARCQCKFAMLFDVFVVRCCCCHRSRPFSCFLCLLRLVYISQFAPFFFLPLPKRHYRTFFMFISHRLHLIAVRRSILCSPLPLLLVCRIYLIFCMRRSESVEFSQESIECRWLCDGLIDSCETNK